MLSEDIFNHVVLPFMNAEQLYQCRNVSSFAMDRFLKYRTRYQQQCFELAIKHDDPILLGNLQRHYGDLYSILLRSIKQGSWKIYRKTLPELSLVDISGYEHCEALECTHIDIDVRRFIEDVIGRKKLPLRFDLTDLFLHKVGAFKRFRIVPFGDRSPKWLEKIVLSRVVASGYTIKSLLNSNRGRIEDRCVLFLSQGWIKFSDIPQDKIFATYDLLSKKHLLTRKMVLDLVFYCYLRYDEQHLPLVMHWISKYCSQVGISLPNIG